MEAVIRKAINEWLRDEAPMLMQMRMQPEHRDALARRIASELKQIEHCF